MNQHAVLVTGAGGMIGFHLCRVIGQKWKTIGTLRNRPSLDELSHTVTLDLTDRSALFRVMEQHRISAIVHAAGNKNVSVLENDPDLARRENVQATEVVTTAARVFGVPLIFISTDYLFDGKKGDYRETDTPCPDTVYGKTKWEAERIVLSWGPCLSVRTAGVLGRSRDGFYSRMMGQILEGKPISAFPRLYNSPISVLRLARVIQDAIHREQFGVVHAAGERTNRFELLRQMAASVDRSPELIRPDDNAGSPEKDYSLNLDRFRDMFPQYTATLAEDLEELVRNRHHK
jgi:dTDP-4-dehydrorhamnose reductase